MERVHCTCVDIDGTGVLLSGPSGSGKSDLALRLIDAGGRLVADDYTEVEIRDGQLTGRAPEAIKGMLEVRGIGVVRREFIAETRIGVMVELAPGGPIERLPDPQTTEVLGISLPLFRIDPFEVSALSKVRLAVQIAHGAIMHVP